MDKKLLVAALVATFPPAFALGTYHSEGDVALQTDQVRTEYGVSGAGVRVGVLGDSWGCGDVDLSELGSFEVLADNCSTGGLDGGRAIAEVVFDIAPQAHVVFHALKQTPTDYAAAAQALFEAGVDLVVSGQQHADMLRMQKDVHTRVAESLWALGVPVVSAAGDLNGSVWTGSATAGKEVGRSGDLVLREVRLAGRASHDFELSVGQSAYISLEWQGHSESSDTAYARTAGDGAVYDMDLYVVTAAGLTADASSVLAFSASDSLDVPEPREFLLFTNDGSYDTDGDGDAGDTRFYVAASILNHADALPPVSLVIAGRGASFPLAEAGAPSLFGPSLTEKALVAGAASWVNYQRSAVAASYSGASGTPRKGDGVLRDHALFLLPDQVQHSFAEDAMTAAGETLSGAPAAVGHLAGLLALWLQADPTLTPDALRDGLVEASAEPEAWTSVSGHGALNALTLFTLNVGPPDAFEPPPTPTPRPTNTPRPAATPTSPPDTTNPPTSSEAGGSGALDYAPLIGLLLLLCFRECNRRP